MRILNISSRKIFRSEDEIDDLKRRVNQLLDDNDKLNRKAHQVSDLVDEMKAEAQERERQRLRILNIRSKSGRNGLNRRMKTAKKKKRRRPNRPTGPELLPGPEVSKKYLPRLHLWSPARSVLSLSPARRVVGGWFTSRKLRRVLAPRRLVLPRRPRSSRTALSS